MADATSGAGTDNPSGTSEFALVISEIRVTRSLVFFEVVRLFVLFALLLYCLSFFELQLLSTIFKLFIY